MSIHPLYVADDYPSDHMALEQRYTAEARHPMPWTPLDWTGALL